MPASPQVLRVAIVGDHSFNGFKKLEAVMRRLTSGRGVARVVFIIVDSRGVGGHAVTVCHELGTHYLSVPKLLAYRDQAEARRNNFVLRFLKPHVVLIFAKDLYTPHVAGARDLADKADKLGIRVVHFK